jgi:hypothetical protein
MRVGVTRAFFVTDDAREREQRWNDGWPTGCGN